MTHHLEILEAFRSSPPTTRRDNLVMRRNLSINGFYLPPEKSLSFQPTPQVERLHVLLEGRLRLIQGGTELEITSGHALGVSAPGAHQLRSVSRGACFLTIAIRKNELSRGAGGGITVLNVLGSQRDECARQLHTWSVTAEIGARTRMIPLELLPPGPLQVSTASERIFIVLEGSARLELPAGPMRLEGPSLLEVAPDTPHRLLKASDSRTTVLVVSDPGPTDDVTNHFSCGNRALQCDLIEHLGIAQLHLDARGHILETSGPIRDCLGVSSADLESNLSGWLLPRDAEWLEGQLGRSGLGLPVRTVWASPHRDGQVLHVTLVPFSGDTHLASALIYLVPITAAREHGLEPRGHDEHLPAPSTFVSVSPSMAEVKQSIVRLAETDSWLVVWGEKSTGKSTAARMFHDAIRASARTLRVLDCEEMGFEPMRNCLFREGGEALLPGPWLEDLGTGSLLLESAYCLPISHQNQLLRSLSELRETGHFSGRIIVELNRRPQKGLPLASSNGTHPKRGPFVVLELPPLRARPEDIPALLEVFWKKHAEDTCPPKMTSNALTALLAHRYPGNLEDLERLTRSIISARLEGPLTSAVLQSLLGEDTSTDLGGEDPLPTLARAQHQLIARALQQTNGNKARVAQLLGISRARVYRMIAEYHLED